MGKSSGFALYTSNSCYFPRYHAHGTVAGHESGEQRARGQRPKTRTRDGGITGAGLEQDIHDRVHQRVIPGQELEVLSLEGPLTRGGEQRGGPLTERGREVVVEVELAPAVVGLLEVVADRDLVLADKPRGGLLGPLAHGDVEFGPGPL